ncbi:bacterial transcriptional activator domain-containing protein [Solwaraspora sp. WMMD1047]|uniref:bacterial transcriptional activator domain-containing protein n=1 Tax=Solwaraspora sp. WMMD1047 TaxID=3016102 RepID=UPI002417AED6|nr:bacterial transcriptional activator domain-containing protein [Solwaraspora sp. WMMD1047]MDG4834187.1 bacterial transcriptional activator domain-containing protein [Solwaraspora sp. WMMD1047]
MRWPRRLASAALTVGLLVGPPWVLVRVVGWPLLRQAPTGDEVRRWVAQPLTEQSVTGGLTVLAWVIWLLFALAVVRAVLWRLRGVVRRIRRLPVPAPAQATAGGLVGVAVFGVGAGATAAVSPPDPQPAEATTGQPFTDGHTTAAAAPAARAGVGVGLPDGGWLPDEVAEVAAGAAVFGWLRRRRDYQPGAPGRDAGRNADLTPDSRTVRAVLAAVTDPDAPPGPPGPRGQVTDRNGPVLGQWPTGPVLRPGDLPASVGLTGPAAADAARGILVAALLTADAGGPRLVTTVDTLTGLDLDAPRLTAVAGLTVAATLDDALVHIERHRTSADPASSGGGPGGRDQPLLVLIDPRGGDPAAVMRLRAGAVGAVTVVVLGGGPEETWQVLPDGTTTVDGGRRAGPRLCVLGAGATADLLAVTGHLPPPTATPTPPAPARVRRPAGAGVPVLRLRVLGQVSATVAGRPVLLRRSAAWQVLVYLAAHPAGATAAELTEAIWPHLRPASITGRLYTTISELRRTLHTDGVTVIDRAGNRYRLPADTVEVDLWRLTAAVDEAATAVGAADRDRTLRQAIGAYPGELAAGHDWPWLPPVREALRRQVIDAYAALAAEADPPTALRLLRDAVGVDPLNEDLHRRTVRALAAVGDRDGIDTLLDRYARTLAAAGLPPGGDPRHDTTAQPAPHRPLRPRPSPRL